MVPQEINNILRRVEDFESSPVEFRLKLQPEVWGNSALMAVITDKILKKGWWPDGYEQIDKLRIYRYREAN